MRNRRYLFFECTVALIVLSLLLVTVFPKFQKAQTLTKLTEVRKDLNAIITAMESYRLDNPSHPIQRTSILGSWGNPSAYKIDIVSLLETDSKFIAFSLLASNKISPYLGKPPVPKFPMEIEGNIPNGWNPMYTVGSLECRWRLESLPSKEDYKALFWFTFYKDLYRSDYLGVAHGPLFTFPSQKEWNNINDNVQFVFYDPSNGVMSNGYVTVESGSSGSKRHLIGYPTRTSVEWTPQKRPLKANLTEPPTPAAVHGATDLIRLHRSYITSLDVTYFCTFTNRFVWDDPFWSLERQKHFRLKSIKGELSHLTTPHEVDSFYQSRGKTQIYDVEYRYQIAGEDKQRFVMHSPAGTVFPWECVQEHILNVDRRLSIFHPRKIAYTRTLSPEQKRFQPVRYFDPMWFITPFAGFSTSDKIRMENQEDGLVRVRYESESYLNNPTLFFSIDCVLDPSIDFMPRRCSFASPALNMSIPDSDDKVKMLDAWYVELSDYKPIDGVWFPCRLDVSKWHHRHNVQGMVTLGSRTGYHEGFEIPDVIGGELVPVFQRQWDLTLISARINQPIDEGCFWPDAPAVYEFSDLRPYNQKTGVVRNYTDEEKKKWRGVGPHTFERRPNYEK